MRDGRLDQLVDKIGQVRGGVRGHDALDRFQQVRPLGPDQRGQKRGLAGKILVKRPDRDPGPRRDRVRRQRVQPSTRAKIGGGGKDPVDFGAGAVLAGLFAKLDHPATVGA